MSLFLILKEQDELIKIQEHLIYLTLTADTVVADEYNLAISEFIDAQKRYRAVYMHQPQPLPALEAAQQELVRAQRVFIKAQHEHLVRNKFFEEGIDAR